jgi:hypothetical protein
MKINRKLELKFLKAIKKQDSKWKKKELVDFNERNLFVKQHFKLNKEIVQKLQKLNDKLSRAEKRIFPIYRNLQIVNQKLILEKTIDDFNIDVIISTYSNNHYKYLDENWFENPIIETNCNFMNLQEGDSYTEEDWKENARKEPILDFKHCYSFHHLYDHTFLTWYDLSIIENIWIEIKVDYQFIRKI